jgi:hypothetical protein
MKNLLLLLVSILLAPNLAFAIIVAEQSTESSVTTGDRTISHDGGTFTDDVAIVRIAHLYGGDGITGVTYDGNAMTELQAGVATANYIFYYLNPPDGTVNVVADFITGAEGRQSKIWIDTFSGIDVSNPVYYSSSTNGSTITTLQLTAPVTKDGLVIDAISTNTGTNSTYSGAGALVSTGDYSQFSNGRWGAANSTSTASTTQTHTWTLTGNTNDYGMVIASFNAVQESQEVSPITEFSGNSALSGNSAIQ